MINQKNVELGRKRSSIRELFEYGKKRKAEIGEDKVFDFSIGNPSVPAPAEVQNALKEIITRVFAQLHLGAGRFFRTQNACRLYKSAL